MAFRKDNKIKSNFSKISIGLASPEEILENSSGEVLKPETINYRTYKPEPVSYTHLAPLNDDGTFIRDKVKARQDADYPVVTPDEVELMDVSPQQIASIAASLIPFLEHDDANRALMGSNTVSYTHLINPRGPSTRPSAPILPMIDGIVMITSTSVHPPLIFSIYSSRPT